MGQFDMSPFESVAPGAMDPSALDQFQAPPQGNVVGWDTPQAPEGRSWGDKLSNALLLAASIAPIGRMMGSKLGRLTLGAGAGLGVGAAMSDPAQAADGSGDAVLDALNSQLAIKQQQFQEEYQGKSGTKVKGSGPATQRIQNEITNLTSQIKARQQELRDQSLIETPAQKLERERMENELAGEKQKRADERAESNRGRFWEGAGAGAAAGGALSLLGGALTRGRLNRFRQVADDLGALTQKNRKGTFAGAGVADEVAAKVDEANSLRGMDKPFGENFDAPGPFTKAETKARAKANRASGPDLGENFEKPYSFGAAGEMALPILGATDFAAMKTMGAMQDKPEDAQAYDDMANLGLGFAVGSKGGRMITKPFTTGATLARIGSKGSKALSTGDAGAVNSARNKLQREIRTPAAPNPSAAPAAPTGPSGSGSQPVRKPPGQGGGLPITALRQRAQQAAQSRAAFHSNGANPNMTKAIAAVQARGARITADTVMRELKGSLGGSKVDGVSINRRQIGKWLKTHGYL